MARSKNYKGSTRLNGPSGKTPFVSAEQTADISLGEFASAQARNPSNTSTIRLSPWLGQGLDAWVYAFASTLADLLNSGSVESATVVGYSEATRRFLEYLHTSGAGPTNPVDLKPEDILRFTSALKLRYPLRATARGVYQRLKSVLLRMCESGLIREEPAALFPRNPFPGGKTGKGGQDPLSAGEMQQLAAAVRTDITDSFHGRVVLPEASVLAAYLLVLAMRTGANTTPLLELSRDSLQPHILPNLRRLVLVKHRGKKRHSAALRESNSPPLECSLPLDGVAILDRALARTEPLVDDAPAALKNRVWLLRRASDGLVTSLSSSGLRSALNSLRERHALTGDDGLPLVLNVSRLRKTMEQRLWRLSDGDLITVAQAMGQTPAVADSSYLTLDPKALVEAAVFVADELTGLLRTKDGARQVTDLVETPTGRCQDTLQGHGAPKNGTSHCENFLHCLTCPSFAIVGSPDDMYRVLSFAAFLRAEAAYLKGDEWESLRARHAQAINFIDDFTRENFAADVVAEAKRRLESGPHRFWAIRMQNAGLEVLRG
jgi:hypothetical protein